MLQHTKTIPCSQLYGNSLEMAPSCTKQGPQRHGWQSGVDELDWPAQSADLNPIDHLWDELDWRLRARPSGPTSVCDLTNAPMEEWSKIPMNTLLNFVDRRDEAVLAAKGGPTSY